MGLILTQTENGLFVKGFSNKSIALETGKINIGDRLIVVNNHEVKNVYDAKNFLGLVRVGCISHRLGKSCSPRLFAKSYGSQ